MHVHACGRRDFGYASKTFAEFGLEGNDSVSIFEYIYNMPIMMAAADIIVCRGGAMTISEIAAMRKAAVIIPSPNVTDDHQYKNAKLLADKDAAIVVRESELTEGGIISIIDELISSPDKREKMEENIKDFYSEDVRKTIYSEICALLKK